MSPPTARYPIGDNWSNECSTVKTPLVVTLKSPSTPGEPSRDATPNSAPSGPSTRGPTGAGPPASPNVYTVVNVPDASILKSVAAAALFADVRPYKCPSE